MKLSYLFFFLVLGNTIYANQIVFKPNSDEVLVNIGDTTKKKNAEKKPVKEVEIVTIEEPNEILVEDQSTENDSLKIFTEAEFMPKFVGGEIELNKFLNKNMLYPNLAKENNIEGRVIIRFVVEKDGSLSNIEILKKLGFGCDEEVIRLIKTMPKWNPGKTYGKAVRVNYILPIVFKL